jgi:cysteine desulfurase
VKLLYFDHNATTPLAPEVAEMMTCALREVYGNASSVHSRGQFARKHLEESRRKIAGYLDVSPPELLFTSGGSEANNLAILGLIRSLPDGLKHAITSAIEHPSVLEVFRQLEREGVHVTYLQVDASGVIDSEAIACALRPDTVLISLMHANNETGAIQPVNEAAKLVQERRRAGQRIFLHSDGVQAFGKIGVDLAQLGVDLYSISAHKIFGPKGIGGLFVRKGISLYPVLFGGRQERGRRPGTENVPAALGFARAVDICDPAASNHQAILRDGFEAKLLSSLDGIEVNGTRHNRLPNTSNLFLAGVSAETLVIALDRQNMAVSTGSACSSGSVEPSHVLLAMGRSRDEARSSVRFSFGRYNTAQEADALAGAVISAAGRLRRRALQEGRLAG